MNSSVEISTTIVRWWTCNFENTIWLKRKILKTKYHNRKQIRNLQSGDFNEFLNSINYHFHEYIQISYH